MTKRLLANTLLLSSSLIILTANAVDAPAAENLVGNLYGGLHALRMDIDGDRLITASPNSELDHANGFGLELAYRFTESAEFRLSHSLLNLVKKNPVFKAPDGSSTTLDVLYFPTQQNFYLVGGVDHLVMVESKPSLNIGAGYRHYLSERAALYFEGKGDYQFDNSHKDWTAKIGLIYFFGETKKPVKKAIPVIKSVSAKPADHVANIAEKDSDKDGIVDKLDHCMNTPMSDKVDPIGCTIFEEEKLSMELVVNFDNNKAIVKDQYLPEIRRVASFLSIYPHTNIVIEGHTSKLGSETYNKKISQQRAEAVAAILVEQYDIDQRRVDAVGYGEERLIKQGDSSAAHAANRRIEAKVDVVKRKATLR